MAGGYKYSIDSLDKASAGSGSYGPGSGGPVDNSGSVEYSSHTIGPSNINTTISNWPPASAVIKYSGTIKLASGDIEEFSNAEYVEVEASGALSIHLEKTVHTWAAGQWVYCMKNQVEDYPEETEDAPF